MFLLCKYLPVSHKVEVIKGCQYTMILSKDFNFIPTINLYYQSGDMFYLTNPSCVRSKTSKAFQVLYVFN